MENHRVTNFRFRIERPLHFEGRNPIAAAQNRPIPRNLKPQINLPLPRRGGICGQKNTLQLLNSKRGRNEYKYDKRAVGIEPTTTAWKAMVLPLNYARNGNTLYHTNRKEANLESAPCEIGEEFNEPQES
jgi:hypothetical protein